MAIDHTASVANMARMWLMSLDRGSLNTSIPTASLELMLNKLVELAVPEATLKVADSAQRSVLATAVRRGE